MTDNAIAAARRYLAYRERQRNANYPLGNPLNDDDVEGIARALLAVAERVTDDAIAAAARRILEFWLPDYGNEDEVIVAEAYLALAERRCSVDGGKMCPTTCARADECAWNPKGFDPATVEEE